MSTEDKSDARRFMELRDELTELNNRIGALELRVSGLVLGGVSTALLLALFPTWFIDSGDELSGWASITTGLVELSEADDAALVFGVLLLGLLLSAFVVAATGLRAAVIASAGWSKAAAILGALYGTGMIGVALLALALSAGDSNAEVGAGPWLAGLAGIAVGVAGGSHRKNCERL